jgi:uncharacterized protein YbaA (DUF1428 family)
MILFYKLIILTAPSFPAFLYIRFFSTIIVSKSDSKGENLVTHFVYRIPKKNHDAMLQLCKESNKLFMHHDVARYDAFQLSNTEVPMEGFTNIADMVSASQEEEIWLESLYYRDRQHMNEVMVKMQKDERMEPIMKQSFSLISSGTNFIMGEFDRLSV